MSLYSVALLVALAAASADWSLALAQTPSTLRALLIQYRCPVVDRLERIYEAGDLASPRNRFLAVTVGGHPHGYVQCMFYDQGSKLLCEAASGFYAAKPGRPPSFALSAEAIAALGRLGFSTGEAQGNFRAEFDVADPPDFNAIADFMLRALHDGYGAREVSNLRFNAPFARRATSKCIPVS